MAKEQNKKKPGNNKPKFNSYWIYIGIVLIFLGLNFFGGMGFNEPAKSNISEFENYLSGIPTSFDKITLDISDKMPDFYRSSLMECMGIPYGETLSYKQIAEKLGKPRSARAVGLAMARNPLPIIIPCHRVVRSDGGLGGYGGTHSNISIKQLFLDIEKHSYQSNKIR